MDMRFNPKNIICGCLFFVSVSITASCSKLITVEEPNNTITTVKMFENDLKAESAIAGVYNNMIHATASPGFMQDVGMQSFAAGLTDIAGGLSAGEFVNREGAQNAIQYALASNTLTLTNSNLTNTIWNSAYNVLYVANAVIEGIAASTSSKLTEKARKEITAEAKFVRAFCFFYLTNFFGDVPLTLSGDFNQTAQLPRSPQQAVYKQVLDDLIDAAAALPADYTAGKGSRVRPNKFAALAMLAKVYLYLGDHEKAAARAGEVIAETGLFKLEPDTEGVFLTTSGEAIWQLRQTEMDPSLKNATPIGNLMLPLAPTAQQFYLSDDLLGLFEPGDLRYANWIGSLANDWPGGSNIRTYYPAKYKINSVNGMQFAPPREYYMVLRLAEMYLIRAEARANGATGGTVEAIKDLNQIRDRADVSLLPLDLDANAVKTAIEKERQRELFCEWGNRWFDLKRTGKAVAVLSAMSHKQPWEGDYQLLYPIPKTETEMNKKLIQNIGYTR